jgi:hypothetical protein
MSNKGVVRLIQPHRVQWIIPDGYNLWKAGMIARSYINYAYLGG